eukprot:279670-Amphidinium_carterae.1
MRELCNGLLKVRFAVCCVHLSARMRLPAHINFHGHHNMRSGRCVSVRDINMGAKKLTDRGCHGSAGPSWQRTLSAGSHIPEATSSK